MRETVFITLGGQERPLKPAYAVFDAFESRHGGLLDFLRSLSEGTAPLEARAFLICEGLKAADASVAWKIDAVKQRMFEEGAWHIDLISKEVEFIERLMYTPEQYTRKKEAEKAAAQKAAETAEAAFSDLFSPSQQ